MQGTLDTCKGKKPSHHNGDQDEQGHQEDHDQPRCQELVAPEDPPVREGGVGLEYGFKDRTVRSKSAFRRRRRKYGAGVDDQVIWECRCYVVVSVCELGF